MSSEARTIALVVNGKPSQKTKKTGNFENHFIFSKKISGCFQGKKKSPPGKL